MKYPKIILLIASGTMMIGQGSRMIVEGIVADSWYRPNTFDILFDWTTLSIAGLLIFSWGFYMFYSRYREDHDLKWNIQCPECGLVYSENIIRGRTECPGCYSTGSIDLDGFDMDHARKVYSGKNPMEI